MGEMGKGDGKGVMGKREMRRKGWWLLHQKRDLIFKQRPLPSFIYDFPSASPSSPSLRNVNEIDHVLQPVRLDE